MLTFDPVINDISHILTNPNELLISHIMNGRQHIINDSLLARSGIIRGDK